MKKYQHLESMVSIWVNVRLRTSFTSSRSTFSIPRKRGTKHQHHHYCFNHHHPCHHYYHHHQSLLSSLLPILFGSIGRNKTIIIIIVITKIIIIISSSIIIIIIIVYWLHPPDADCFWRPLGGRLSPPLPPGWPHFNYLYNYPNMFSSKCKYWLDGLPEMENIVFF